MIEKATSEILRFRDSRNWKQFHNTKDLAISLSLEAAELLENFQWSSSDEAVSNRFNEIKEELADILIYSILLADSIGIKAEEIENIILEKIKVNERKYPIEKAFDNKNKYTEL